MFHLTNLSLPEHRP